MAVQDPPLFLQSDAHPAKHFRQLIAAAFGLDLSTSHSGVVIGQDDLLVTEKSGTPNMSVDVAKGRMVVPGTEANDQSSYLVTNAATVNVVIATADATNPRNDLVYVQVRDAGGGYSGSDNDCRIAVATGTPAASPADPSLPVNAYTLARVVVPANDTAITDSQITDGRRYASALGGITVCTSTSRPSGVKLRRGLFAYETDTKRIIMYDGTGWIKWSTQWETYTPTLTNLTLGNGTRTAAFRLDGGVCWVRFGFVTGSSSAVGTDPTISLPFTAADPDGRVAAAAEVTGNVWLLDQGTANFDGIVRLNATTSFDLLARRQHAGGTYIDYQAVSATVPFTWTPANADKMFVSPFRYQLASAYDG